MKTIKRKWGWTPDLPDRRDKLFTRKPSLVKLPPKVDLRPLCSKVEDQGELGSCTANALAGALEFLEIKNGVKFCDFSRLFIYYNERVIERSVNYDSGAMIRDGIKTLAKDGCCPESMWPYAVDQFTKKPNPTCYQEATKHQIQSYSRILTLDQMKSCLAEGYPFTFGFTVYESFESQSVARNGIVPMPGRNERTLGGHAVLGVGYDDSRQWAIVRNSWGTEWGDKGYFYMPYKYLSNRNLSDDFWKISKLEQGE